MYRFSGDLIYDAASHMVTFTGENSGKIALPEGRKYCFNIKNDVKYNFVASKEDLWQVNLPLAMQCSKNLILDLVQVHQKLCLLLL